MECAIDEFEDVKGPDVDELAHLSICFDITLEPQTITKREVEYICRLYRIPTSSLPYLITPSVDVAQPLNMAVVVPKRFFECELSLPFSLFPRR